MQTANPSPSEIEQHIRDRIRALLTEQEAAEFLDLKAGTLAVWRSVGRYPELRYVKIGRNIRYRVTDLESFLQSRTRSATA